MSQAVPKQPAHVFQAEYISNARGTSTYCELVIFVRQKLATTQDTVMRHKSRDNESVTAYFVARVARGLPQRQRLGTHVVVLFVSTHMCKFTICLDCSNRSVVFFPTCLLDVSLYTATWRCRSCRRCSKASRNASFSSPIARSCHTVKTGLAHILPLCCLAVSKSSKQHIWS